MSRSTKNKISVVIPAFNEQKCIARCINSVKKQTYKPYEIIVVCDDCTDDTVKIAKRLKAKVYEIKHSNVAKTRNYGARRAKGDILVFLDADSIMARNLLFEINDAINRGYIGGTCKTKALEPILRGRLAWALSNLVRAFYLVASGILFCKKSVFPGYPDRRIAEDTYLIRSLSRKGKLKYIKNSYIKTSLRRFEKQGYIKTSIKQIISWMKKSDYEYKPIR